jgi:peptide deformylase
MSSIVSKLVGKRNGPLNVITMGHKTLREKTLPVSDEFILSKEGKTFIKQMFATLEATEDGV